MRTRAIGLLESIGLAEDIGDKALAYDEYLFMMEAKKNIGCRCLNSGLSLSDRMRVLSLGKKCLKWKDDKK